MLVFDELFESDDPTTLKDPLSSYYALLKLIKR